MNLSTSILNIGRLTNRSSEVVDREIDEELDFHIECHTRDLIEAGMTSELAAEEANRQFGVRQKIRRECRAIHYGNHIWLLTGLAATVVIALAAIGWMAMLLKSAHQKNQDMLAVINSLQGQDDLDLAGEVKDDKGQPIAGAKVLLIHKSWPGGNYQQTPHQTITDDKGKFKFPKQYSSEFQNAFLVTILAAGHTMQSEYEIYKTKAKAKLFRFKLKPAIEKTLLLFGDDGQPLADTIVFPGIRKQGSKEHMMYDQSAEAAGFKTDDEGKVKMSLFAAKDKVKLKSPDGRQIDFVVDDSSEQKVGAPNEAGAESGIRGIATDESGKPISKAKVLLIHKTWPGGQFHQTASESATGADGTFAFPDCNQADEQEAFLVTIVHENFAFESQYVIKKPDETAGSFEFKLTAANKKTFLLKDESGKPLENQVVSLSSRKGSKSKEHLIYGLSQGSVSFRTNKDGKIELNFFQAGDRARLSVGGNEIEFKVNEDAEQTVELKKKVTPR